MNDQVKQNWYVVKTNPRAEKKVYDRIISLGIDAYLPLVSTIRQWSDRKKKVDLPLISSTLFINCSEKDFSKIFNVPGFHSFLYYLRKPAIVRDYEINNLRILLQENVEFESIETEKLLKGDRVEVIRGPFQGLIATSVEIDRSHKLIVEIEGMDQKFIVHVPRTYVRKIRSN
jgi:transcription antitermination factor NusG